LYLEVAHVLKSAGLNAAAPGRVSASNARSVAAAAAALERRAVDDHSPLFALPPISPPLPLPDSRQQDSASPPVIGRMTTNLGFSG